MSRPAYESEDDLKREQQAIEAVEAIWGVQCRKTPRYYEIDYCIVNTAGDVQGWIEVRCKNFRKDQHKTFYTSLKKYITLCRFSQTTGLPAFILCKWEDSPVCVYKVDTDDVKRCRISIGGRTVNLRGDDQDIEPVIHLSIESFVNLDHF